MKRAKSKKKKPSGKSSGYSDELAMKTIEVEYNRLKKADEDDSEDIGPDGIQALCNELKVDAEEDIEILLVAWKCNCTTMGVITKSEFFNGLMSVKCMDIPSLKKKLPQLVEEITTDANQYKEFYKFVFQLARDGTIKTIPKETAMALMSIVMIGHSIHLSKYLAFLEQADSVKRINADQWNGFLEFSRQISADYSNFDDDGAWPLLLDEFVEYAMQQMTDQKAKNLD